MPKIQRVSIQNLSNGAALERLNLELDRVWENILDPNTAPRAPRKITLELTIKPSDDRGCGAVAIQTKAKLAPVRGHTTQVYEGKDEEGNAEASEMVLDTQLELFQQNVTDIKSKEVSND